MAKGFTVQVNQHTEYQLSENWTEMNLKKKKKLTYTFWQLWFQVSLLVFRWVWSSPMRMQCKWHHAMNMLIVRVLMHLSFIFQSYGTKFFRLAPSFGFCYFDFEYSFLTLWKKKKLLLLFRLPEELPKMALETALKECFTALNFFLNNRFADALALLKPW